MIPRLVCKPSHRPLLGVLSRENFCLGWSVSRILSGRGMRVYAPKGFVPAPCLGDHLSRRCVTAPLKRPTRNWPAHYRAAHEETSRLLPSADGVVPAWPCSWRGLPGRLHCCKRRWSLTPPFHHHSAPKCGAVCFCGPLPVGRLQTKSPRPGCYPTPCPMECGLSSIPQTQDRGRPTSLRQFHHTRLGRERQLEQTWNPFGVNRVKS